MAAPSPIRMTSGTDILDSASDSANASSSPYRDSFTDDEDMPQDYITERTRQTFFGRVLHTLGIDFRPRRPDDAEYLFLTPPGEDLPAGLLKTHSSQHRRCRRTKAGTILRRTILALPFVVLMLFGILHLIHVIVGRRALLWDLGEYDDFLPDWGKNGHVGAGLAEYPTDATRDVLPIRCHSHNDYWRRVPLLEAIHWGCTSVEADVWLFDEELFVGHNTASLTRNRTFRNLYVNPIRDLLDTMNPNTHFANISGHGIFDEDPEQTLVLLVDFKTAGAELFPYVYDQLEALREKNYLSYWDGEKFHSRAVTVVGTGNTPFDKVVANKNHRDIFFDAPLNRLWEPPRKPIEADDGLHDRDGEIDYGTAMSLSNNPDDEPYQGSNQGRVGTELADSPDAFDPSNSYYASVSFASTVGFVWRGHLSPRQMNIIRGQVRGAKKRGLKARYWNTPSWPVSLRNHIWHVLMREGADVLNVDDLKGAATEDWKARVRGFWD